MKSLFYIVQVFNMKKELSIALSRNMINNTPKPPFVATRAAIRAAAACLAAVVAFGCPSLELVPRHKEITTDNKDGRSYDRHWSLEPPC